MRLRSLNELAVGEHAEVVAICAPPSVRKRLLDLGFVKGALVTLALVSLFGDPKAYYIAGAVIAVRDCDAKEVSVEIIEGRACA